MQNLQLLGIAAYILAGVFEKLWENDLNKKRKVCSRVLRTKCFVCLGFPTFFYEINIILTNKTLFYPHLLKSDQVVFL